jgi:hypothetical protein
MEEDLFTSGQESKFAVQKRLLSSMEALYSFHLSRSSDRLQRFETEKELVKVTIRRRRKPIAFTCLGKE